MKNLAASLILVSGLIAVSDTVKSSESSTQATETATSVPEHDGKWKDALSEMDAPAFEDKEEILLGLPRPVIEQVSFQEIPVPEPESVSPQVMARKILVDHLLQIRESGVMMNTIATEEYWQDVYAFKGHPELYDMAKKEISAALEGGLKPYTLGEVMTAAQFSDLALQSISNPTYQPLAAYPDESPKP